MLVFNLDQMEPESAQTFAFKLSPEEESWIRREEEEALIRNSASAIHPVAIDYPLQNLGLTVYQFDRRGDQDFSKNISPPSEIHVRGGF